MAPFYPGSSQRLPSTDLYAGVPALKSAARLRGRPSKQNTISDYVAIMKQLYLLLIDNEYSPVSREKVKKNADSLERSFDQDDLCHLKDQVQFRS
jgi:hypothetical protein